MREASQKPWRITTQLRLLWAGWRQTRNVWGALTLPAHLPVFPEAKRVLSQFGKLRFGCIEDHVTLDPPLGGEALLQEIRVCEQGLGRRLYPVGVWFLEADEHYLIIDEIGRVYTLISAWTHGQLEMCELEPRASSFERAIEFLLRRHVRGTRLEMKQDLQKHGMNDQVWRFRIDSHGTV